MPKTYKAARRGLVALFGSVVGAGLIVSPAQAATPKVQLTFGSMGNSGSAAVSVQVARSGAGTVSTVSDAGWLGRVARTPSYDPRSGAPRGVLRITPTGGDPLSPGSRAFSFGADVTLDAGVTSSHGSGSTDNGDNVVQRGRYGDRGQYKIQVDGRRPSCRIKGGSGTVMVTSRVKLAAGTWYGLTCSRSGSTVTLTVKRYSSSGSVVQSTTTTGRGATGSISAPASRPMSVGGKLTSSGQVARDSDQFNGRVDNVTLTIS
jgi:hypothetical protein